MQIWDSQNKSLVTRGFSLKTFNLLRFLLIFISAVVLLQILSFNVSASVNSNKIFTSSKSTEKLFSDKSVSSENPLHSGQSSNGVEAEVEPNEDDIHHNLSESSNSSVQKFILDELIYTSFIKSRYLRMASSIYRQAEVPYFVLYHSWKNYLV